MSALQLPPPQHQFGADDRLEGKKLKGENFIISALRSIMSDVVPQYFVCALSL